jgi:Aspartyl protease
MTEQHSSRDNRTSKLPPEIPINENAGRGGWVVVTLHTGDGDSFPFLLDTGTSGTLFDKSAETKLGKSLGDVSVNGWGHKKTGHIYTMPRLYLGDVLLKTPSETATYDLGPLKDGTGTHIVGIIGYDTLRHYCIQMDFAAAKMRFLDDKTADKSSWGKAFSIVDLNVDDGRPSVAQNLLGQHGPHSLIDTGSNNDGWLMTRNYWQWTNGVPVKGQSKKPYGLFHGTKYPSVSLGAANVESDGIGIRFLARHLVTLDFPKHKLYLKLQTLSPLPNPKK